jgi:Uma2 family endonuclease
MSAPIVDRTRRWTAQEVMDLPSDGNRYEVVDGELLVTPAPAMRHQQVITRLMAKLSAYLDQFGRLNTLFLGPADISWGAEILVQPDILVINPEEAQTGKWQHVKTLLLAVEVLSPSSVRHDRVVKRRAYQRHGVATYWIVDPDAKLVEVWHPEDERPEIVTDVLRWRLVPALPELELDVAALTKE